METTMLNMKQKSVDVHSFSMIPKSEIPRSSFPIQHNLKTAFDFSELVPILCVEVLPGDHWNCKTTVVARTAVPLVPVMDNWHIDLFAFMVPNRIVWDNWVRMMGEQDDPSSSISYSIPQVVSAAGGFPVGSVYDYFGLPTVGQVGGGATISVNALPLRAYNLIYNQWFRDENLQNSVQVNKNSDGPDLVGYFNLLKARQTQGLLHQRTTLAAKRKHSCHSSPRHLSTRGTKRRHYSHVAPRGRSRCTRTPVHRRHNQHRLERRQRRQHRNRGVGKPNGPQD